jgi:hypothetical protein
MSDSPGHPIQRRRFVGRAASVVGASTLLGAKALYGDDQSRRFCGKPQRAALEARVIAKSWRDPRYLEEVKRDPGRMLSRELHTEIPSGLRIRVVEEQSDLIYLVIPVNPNRLSDKRVSNDELMAVASGIRFDTPCDTVASWMPVWFQSLKYYPRSNDL